MTWASFELSECLREKLRSFLLLTQTLIKEHARVAQERPASIGKNELFVAHLNQSVAYQRIEEDCRVPGFFRLYLDLETSHEHKNRLRCTVTFIGKQDPT